MKIEYFGQSCFMFHFAGKKILTDPFISGNPLAGNIQLDNIQPDYIFLSHGHADHLADLEIVARQSGAKIIASFDIMETFIAPLGLEGYGMNTGGKLSLDGFTFKIVNAVHSSMLPNHAYGGNPFGFVFWDDTTCFYFAGDTALTYDMKLIPLMCPALDFAVLPIGDYFTMDYKDARVAADFIKCGTIIGAHFDSFPPITIDHDAAQAYFAADNKTLYLPKVGGIFDL